MDYVRVIVGIKKKQKKKKKKKIMGYYFNGKKLITLYH
jgi:hypothetical protein